MNELEQDVINQAMNLLEQDCGDNSCIFVINKGGMRTNGGCHCIDVHNPEFRLKMIRLVKACKNYHLTLEKTEK